MLIFESLPPSLHSSPISPFLPHLFVPTPSLHSSPFPPSLPPSLPPGFLGSSDQVHAELIWDRSFAYPVHGLWYGDLTGDGLSELAVLSTAGVHVLQVGATQFLVTIVRKKCGREEICPSKPFIWHLCHTFC